VSEGDQAARGPIHAMLAADHARLDALLERAGSLENAAERDAFDQFRRGLLKHISMEEKILLPAAQGARGGQALEIAARLRLDHGAMAALLMPPPSPAIIRALRAIIAAHNRIEEQSGGAYDECERLAGADARGLLERLRAAPEVPTNPHSDAPRVYQAARRALERAGYDPSLLDRE
jgi:Hemerythrin HHE cation binding domain